MRAAFVCLFTIVALAQSQPARPVRGPLPEVAARLFETEPWLVIAPDWFRKQWVELSGESLAEQRDRFIERYGLVWHREVRLVDEWIVKSRGTPQEPQEPLPRAGPRMSSGSTWTQLDCVPCLNNLALQMLARHLGATVTDETGLKRWPDMKVLWRTGDEADMIRAWREQGFDLVRSARMLEVVVIDAAVEPEKPAEERKRFACQAEPPIRKAIEAGADLALARKYPYDVFVQMAVQDAAADRASLLELYGKLNEPVLASFLGARSRLAEKQRSRELLDRVLVWAPDFPWAHLELVRWFEMHAPSFTDDAESHLRSFRKLCPYSLAVYPRLSLVKDPKLLRDVAETVGRILPLRIDREAMEAWPYAWQLALRLPGDHAATRVLIGRELARLRFLPRSLPWARTLRFGYTLARDEAGRRWIEAIVLREWLDSDLARQIAGQQVVR